MMPQLINDMQIKCLRRNDDAMKIFAGIKIVLLHNNDCIKYRKLLQLKK